VRAKTRRQAITPDWTPGLLCQSSLDRRQTAVFFPCIAWACAFRAGDYASIFFSGPVEAEERHSCPASTGWLFWNIMAHLSLVKKILHRHCAGFEPQRASPYGKWVKAPQLLGKAARVW